MTSTGASRGRRGWPAAPTGSPKRRRPRPGTLSPWWHTQTFHCRARNVCFCYIAGSFYCQIAAVVAMLCCFLLIYYLFLRSFVFINSDWPVCVSSATVNHGLPCHHAHRHDGIWHGQYYGKYTVCVNLVACFEVKTESYITFWMLLKQFMFFLPAPYYLEK